MPPASSSVERAAPHATASHSLSPVLLAPTVDLYHALWKLVVARERQPDGVFSSWPPQQDAGIKQVKTEKSRTSSMMGACAGRAAPGRCGQSCAPAARVPQHG